MPPKITSTWSCWTSLVALTSATLSEVALSSRYRSICRPSKPPFALMSLIAILATLALAIPMNESAPDWSVITPTLIGVSFMALSPRFLGRRIEPYAGSWSRRCDGNGSGRRRKSGTPTHRHEIVRPFHLLLEGGGEDAVGQKVDVFGEEIEHQLVD